MNNDDYISITGLVATTPRAITTAEGLPITEFRVASTRRRYDKATNDWVDQGTNWYTVKTFRQRATNAGASIGKGDRVFASGRLVIKEWASGEKSGYEATIEAFALGHDLTFGRTVFTRNAWPSTASEESSAGAPEDLPASEEPQEGFPSAIEADAVPTPY